MPSAPVSASEWTLQPAFTLESRQLYCSVSGQPARTGEQIVRGPYIDHEGYFDICLDSARQLARLIGYVPPDEADQAVARQLQLEERLVELEAENQRLINLVAELRWFDEATEPDEDEDEDEDE